MTSFPKTEYWGPLVPNVESLDETTNPSSKNYCAPSIAKYTAEFVLVKHNFSIRFSIPAFKSTYKI